MSEATEATAGRNQRRMYGVPETFVIARDGTIAYKHIGPVTPQFAEETLKPLIAKLRR